MLQIENEYETPIESNSYRNNNDHFQNPDKIQEITDYTEQELNGSSSTNNIYQNTSNKIQIHKEKIWTIPLLLESPKNKDFQPSDLEIDFLIDSGAESNIIKIPTWNQIQTLHPKVIPSKTSSKLATVQGSSLNILEKSSYSLFPLDQWNRINF